MKRKKMLMRSLLHMVLGFLVVFLSNCKDNGNPLTAKKPPCPPFLTVSRPPYDSPIWHPSGQFIGFNHTPLKRVTYPYGDLCQGNQEFDGDSSGFWLINVDGSNLRRILPYTLQTPTWSPDGQWIAFVGNRRIFKMRFTGSSFDTTTVVQLTNTGSDFFPAWSPDGQWIVFSYSVCNDSVPCGVWLMTQSGTGLRHIARYGSGPSWFPHSLNLLYGTRAVLANGQAIGDTIWSHDLITNSRRIVAVISGPNYDTRHTQINSDSTIIAFTSAQGSIFPSLWIMDVNGSNKRKLISEWVDVSFGVPFCWNPSGSMIVYTHYRSDNYDYASGTLWLVNTRTGERKQLTFNIPR